MITAVSIWTLTTPSLVLYASQLPQPRLLQALNAMEDPGSGLRWRCPRITDTGPVLRLEPDGAMLSKRERYGNPCDRPLHSSAIPPARFEAAVVTFFEHALRGCQPRTGGWEWTDMHAYNRGLDFSSWSQSLQT